MTLVKVRQMAACLLLLLPKWNFQGIYSLCIRLKITLMIWDEPWVKTPLKSSHLNIWQNFLSKGFQIAFDWVLRTSLLTNQWWLGANNTFFLFLPHAFCLVFTTVISTNLEFLLPYKLTPKFLETHPNGHFCLPWGAVLGFNAILSCQRRWKCMWVEVYVQ